MDFDTILDETISVYATLCDNQTERDDDETLELTSVDKDQVQEICEQWGGEITGVNAVTVNNWGQLNIDVCIPNRAGFNALKDLKGDDDDR